MEVGSRWRWPSPLTTHKRSLDRRAAADRAPAQWRPRATSSPTPVAAEPECPTGSLAIERNSQAPTPVLPVRPAGPPLTNALLTSFDIASVDGQTGDLLLNLRSFPSTSPQQPLPQLLVEVEEPLQHEARSPPRNPPPPPLRRRRSSRPAFAIVDNASEDAVDDRNGKDKYHGSVLDSFHRWTVRHGKSAVMASAALLLSVFLLPPAKIALHAMSPSPPASAVRWGRAAPSAATTETEPTISECPTAPWKPDENMRGK